MKITHYEEWWFDSIPFFHEVCPLLCPCAKKEQVCVCLVGTMLCPTHVGKFLLCKSHHHVSNSIPWIPSFRAPNSLKSEGARSGLFSWWGKSEHKLLWCLLVRLNSYEMLPEFCQHPYLGIRLDCLLSQHHIHKSHSFTVPEDSVDHLAHLRETDNGVIPQIAFLSLIQNDGPCFISC
jgi:hypothetical protein